MSRWMPRLLLLPCKTVAHSWHIYPYSWHTIVQPGKLSVAQTTSGKLINKRKKPTILVIAGFSDMVEVTGFEG